MNGVKCLFRFCLLLQLVTEVVTKTGCNVTNKYKTLPPYYKDGGRIYPRLKCDDECFKRCRVTSGSMTSDVYVYCRQMDCSCVPKSIPRNATHINFNGNHLAKISSRTFEDLPELIDLDLSYNRICDIDEDTFTGLVRLRRLDLRFNTNIVFPLRLFWPLKNLRELHLSRTVRMLYFNSEWLRNLKELRNFSCGQNQLLEIPRISYRRGHSLLPKLEELSLESNSIRKLKPVQMYGLNSLRRLLLRGNSINVIQTKTFLQLNFLEFLDLQENPLAKLDRWSLCSNSLKVLDLGNSRIFLNGRKNPLGINNSITSLNLSRTYLNNDHLVRFTRDYASLKYLDASNNNIDQVVSETFLDLSSLEELLLANNSLIEISPSSLPTGLWGQLKVLDLSGNPFRCSCPLAEFCRWITGKNFSYSKSLLRGMNCKRMEGLKSRSTPVMQFVSQSEIECFSERNDGTPWFFLSITIAFYILSTTVSTVHRFRWHLRYWYFVQKIKTRRFQECHDKEFAFDAFVSYSQEDSDWVVGQLIPRLESEYHLRLCIHQRDWLPGYDIVDNVVHSIEQSRKTVLIVSNAFAVSQWCHFEMTMAQSRVFQDDRDNLVLVMLEEIADSHMSPRLRMLTERKTYVQWVERGMGNQLFWIKLKQVLTKPTLSVMNRQISLRGYVSDRN